MSKKATRIDAVYTWVDGSRDEHIDLWKQYAEEPGDLNPERYRTTFDLLKYSLRSLEKFTDWIGRVYILTARPQVPEWLDTDHEDIHVVHHDEVMDSKYLPTFNPNTIESFLHRIPGLSDEFLYINDDFLFGSPTFLSDFKPDGKYRIFNTFFGENLGWRIYDGKNDIIGLGLIEHTPLYINKHYWEEMAGCFPEKIHQTRTNKFRKPSDLMTYKLYRYYMLKHRPSESRAISIFKLLKINTFHKLTNDLNAQRKALSKIEKKQPKFYCLNDDLGNHPDPDVVELVQAFLDRNYPEKSSFER